MVKVFFMNWLVERKNVLSKVTLWKMTLDHQNFMSRLVERKSVLSKVTIWKIKILALVEQSLLALDHQNMNRQSMH